MITYVASADSRLDHIGWVVSRSGSARVACQQRVRPAQGWRVVAPEVLRVSTQRGSGALKLAEFDIAHVQAGNTQWTHYSFLSSNLFRRLCFIMHF